MSKKIISWSAIILQTILLLSCLISSCLAQQNGELAITQSAAGSIVQLRKGQQNFLSTELINEQTSINVAGKVQNRIKRSDISNNDQIISVSNPAQQTEVANKIQYLNVNGLPVLVQFTYTGPPKILPIATADSYPEGSSINLICTVSGGQRKGLTLNWNINGDDIDEQKLRYESGSLAGYENVSLDVSGADISILKIWNSTLANAGQYTCTAKNPLGQDSTSVKIVINVELKWSKIPKDTEIGLNQDLALECDAQGSPAPKIEWRRLANNHESKQHVSNVSTISPVVAKGTQLKINRAQHKDSGLYECIASNGIDEELRRLFQIKVRGK